MNFQTLKPRARQIHANQWVVRDPRPCGWISYHTTLAAALQSWFECTTRNPLIKTYPDACRS